MSFSTLGGNSAKVLPSIVLINHCTSVSVFAHFGAYLCVCVAAVLWHFGTCATLKN